MSCKGTTSKTTMVLFFIILGALLLVGLASGLLTYRVKTIKKRRKYTEYLKRMGYDRIGYS